MKPRKPKTDALDLTPTKRQAMDAIVGYTRRPAPGDGKAHFYTAIAKLSIARFSRLDIETYLGVTPKQFDEIVDDPEYAKIYASLFTDVDTQTEWARNLAKLAAPRALETMVASLIQEDSGKVRLKAAEDISRIADLTPEREGPQVVINFTDKQLNFIEQAKALVDQKMPKGLPDDSEKPGNPA